MTTAPRQTSTQIDRAPQRRFAVPMFAIQPGGRTPGLESCSYNLVSGLLRRSAEVDVTVSRRGRLAGDFVARLEAAPGATLSERHYPAPFGRSRFLEETVYAMAPRVADQVIYPNYFVPHTERRRGGTISTVIHDCLHHVYPQYFSSSKRAWLTYNFRRALQKCDVVYLISEWEQGMIAKYYGDRLAERTMVIFNSIDWSRFDFITPPEMPDWVGKRPFILSVCNPYPHKNVPVLIEAFGRFCEHDAETVLALSGASSPAVSAAIAALPAAAQGRVKFVGRLSDQQLGEFYRSASLYVTASRYEGFGMPVVEALGFGVPMIISKSGALPEVTLGLATVLPANFEAGDLADTMLDVLRQGRRPRPSDAERVRAKFSIDAQAARLLDLSEASQ